MRYGLTYHNHQAEGDLKEGKQLKGDPDVCHIVGRFYQTCMSHKHKTGMTQRLLWAYRYLTTDRPSSVNIYAATKDGPSDEDCPDCDADPICVNLDFIGNQFNIALSVLQDALKFRGTDYVTVSPTPIANVSDSSKERIRRSSFNAVMRELVGSVAGQGQTAEEQNLLALDAIHNLLGTDEGLSQIDQFIARQTLVETAKKNAEASVKAKNAKALVDDILAESNYDEVMMIFGSQALWYDYGVIRAPFKATKKDTAIDPKSGFLKEVTRDVWCMENIHPLNHFFSEDTDFNNLGSGEGDVTWLSRSDLGNLKRIKGAQSGAIDVVLKDFLSYTYGYQNESEHEPDNMENWEYSDNIPVIRVIMRLEKSLLEKIFPDQKVTDDSEIAEFWCAADQLLYKKLEPRYVDFNPYRKNGYKIKDLSQITSSRGVYSLLRSAQELIDNAAINVFENLQTLPNYIMEINQSKLKNPDEVEDELLTEKPIVYTNSAGYRAEFGGNDKAVSIIGVPDNIEVYMGAMREGISLMQQLGFSPFALGQQNQSNVRSTGLGSILQQNANKDFSRFLQAQEDFVESPVAKYIWIVQAIEGKDKSIIVDGDIVIQSYTGFLEKDVEKENLGILGQNLVGLFTQRSVLQQQGQDTSWLDSLIAQFAEASGFDSNQLPFGNDVGVSVDPLAGGPVDNVVPPVATDGRTNLPPDLNKVI